MADSQVDVGNGKQGKLKDMGGFFAKIVAAVLLGADGATAASASNPVPTRIIDPATGLALDYTSPTRVVVPDGNQVTFTFSGTESYVIDMLDYEALYLSFFPLGAGSTVVFEESWENTADLTKWHAISAHPRSVNGPTPRDSTTTGGHWAIQKGQRYLQIRQSVFGGTTSTTIFGNLSKAELVPPFSIITGTSPHSAGSGGNPIVVGGAVSTALDTTLVNLDVARFLMSKSQQVITKRDAIPAAEWRYASAASGIVNTTAAVSLKAAASGLDNCVDTIQIAHDALGAATELVITDGVAGTVIWRTKLQTAALPTTTIQISPPLRSTSNTVLQLATLTAVTGGIYVNAQGHVEVS
jgi:hypothetical protein